MVTASLPQKNREIHLLRRPQGLPSLTDFTLYEREKIPSINEGELLVRSLYLSVDPFMRGCIGGRPSIHAQFPLNAPASGDGVGIVVASKHAGFKEGDHLYGKLEWADYSAVAASSMLTFDPHIVAPTTMLSVLGMPAVTAYYGLLDIGKPKPKETVVISAGAGAVGSLVGQIAKMHGCRAVGITSSEKKAKYLFKELQFDAAINYKNDNWFDQLQSACPEGIDIYFDNVGGAISNSVIRKINQGARIVLCGQISSYNMEQQGIGPHYFRELIIKSATARGFRVLHDYKDRFPEARAQLLEWFKQGKIKSCETVVDGLENMPQAFLDLFSGGNIGKQLVKTTLSA